MPRGRIKRYFASWTPTECILCLLVSLVIVIPLTRKVSYSGAWNGDPSRDIRLAMDAVNMFVEEYNKGGEPLKAFLQCYGRFPKMLHGIMLACATLLLHGITSVNFGEMEIFAARFATTWTLLGIVTLYLLIRKFSDRKLTLLMMPMLALSGYILMYANFGRQNMPAHVLCWLALTIYLSYRIRHRSLPVGIALTVGALFGLAVPVHYSSPYIFIALAGSEIMLIMLDRKPLSAFSTIIIIFAAAACIWFVVDLYYNMYALKFPQIVDYKGAKISRSNYSFLSGMAFAFGRVSTKAMWLKIKDPHWWFFAGFVYRNFGIIGALLMGIGAISLPLQLFKTSFRLEPEKKRGLFIVAATMLITIVVSLGYFQSGRKLMPTYPAWGVLMLLGLQQVIHYLLKIRILNFPRKPSSTYRGFAVAALIVVVSLGIYSPTAINIYQYRRDAGFMRNYLATHGIQKVLVMTNGIDSQMAPIQENLLKMSIKQADTFNYIVLHRLFDGPFKGTTFKKQLREIEPIISFKNQIAQPLFWYEFPLETSYLDFSDFLVHSRSLYRWEDVRQIYLDYQRSKEK